MPSDNPPAASLAHWVDWTRAVALSRALDFPPPAAQDGPPPVEALARACADARAALQARVQDAGAWEAAAARAGDDPDAALRAHYRRLQDAIQAGCGRLRGDLREALARLPGGPARLAALDAVMEGVASPREQALLAGVPDRLGPYCQRLRRMARDPGAAQAAVLAALQALLRAELDVRFLPIDGLLAALQPSST